MGNKHLLKCWLWKALWVLSAVALIIAWTDVVRRHAALGVDPVFLLWNALVLGVLAISIKLDCQSCEVCNVKGPQM